MYENLKISSGVEFQNICFFFSSNTFNISKAKKVQPGTKIIMHLNMECRQFSDEDTINSTLEL